eukprot:INCI8925.1.p1 GENE.INCI8925.1~~INCI8925.1.p1  ORF type:complete len:297 (+),score=48.14 INCI8925.1:66-893(+)
MGRYAQFVVGPAGSGKTTYCEAMQKHFETIGRRRAFIINLDPAVDTVAYEPDIDIRELISVDDVMEELNFGPNGALVFCLEYLTSNMDWLQEKLDDYPEDEIYFIIDCPGQIELYTHLRPINVVLEEFKSREYACCSLCLVDSTFVTETPKFISASMMTLAMMVQLELPHTSAITKIDLVNPAEREKLEEYVAPSGRALAYDIHEANLSSHSPRFRSLNSAIGEMLDEYSLVSFIPISVKDRDSLDRLTRHVDVSIQYGEDHEVMVPKTDDGDAM